jgi:hypothetical protein
MGSLLAYVLNFDISVCMAMGVERSIVGGRGGSSYSCSASFTSFEID